MLNRSLPNTTFCALCFLTTNRAQQKDKSETGSREQANRSLDREEAVRKDLLEKESK